MQSLAWVELILKAGTHSGSGKVGLVMFMNRLCLQGYLLQVRCPDRWSSVGMAGSRLTASQPVSCVLTMQPAQPQQVRCWVPSHRGRAMQLHSSL